VQKHFVFILILSLLAKSSIAYDLGINSSLSQTHFTKKDSAVKKHSPKRAAIYSAILPGLGQGYNKKYWKIPVVYGLLGVSTYFMWENRKNLNIYKKEIDLLTDTNGSMIGTFNPQQDIERLKNARDFYKQNRDYSIIAMGLVYVLNIVDATVDAHLFEFNVNQNLAGKIEPQISPYGFRGAKLTFKF